MTITATDWNGNTYWVTRIEGRKARVYQDTQSGSNPWVFATGALAKWTLSAATGTTSSSVLTTVSLASV